MADRNVQVSGLAESINTLEQLGAQGNSVANRAASQAAQLVRDNYLVPVLAGATGISSAIVRQHTGVKRASNKYPAARVNFSGAGIPVREYQFTRRVVNARNNRAQIIVRWIGGRDKVAAGFINPGGRGVPLSTRNEKRQGAKTYRYRLGVLTEAMGPSLATAYQALPDNDVNRQADAYLSERLSYLLDELIN